MWSLEILVSLICILLAIAFLTLSERKILGYIQLRKGPNKVSFLGILQPISDALKLFTKSFLTPLKGTKILFLCSPFLALSLSLMMWNMNPLIFSHPNFKWSILVFMVLSSVTIYYFMLAGWGANSWYSLIGCYRAIAQTISYEVTLALILLSIISFFGTFNFSKMKMLQVWLILPSMILFLIWLASLLAETNRSPFDFAESESELVSGFNTEYSNSSFALLFLAEYGSIIFMSLFTVTLFLQGNFSVFKMMLLIFWISWVRGVTPRLRYDKLMKMAWSNYLPLCLSMFMLFCFLIH